ncbi:hypothetical protein TYRP_023494 [Tyrophagus putrescentiae]|nr:hypothetical protein TYRP_023494 [Tyrophagus putrescentiae]
MHSLAVHGTGRKNLAPLGSFRWLRTRKQNKRGSKRLKFTVVKRCRCTLFFNNFLTCLKWLINRFKKDDLDCVLTNKRKENKKKLRIAQSYYGSIVKMMATLRKKMLKTGNDVLLPLVQSMRFKLMQQPSSNATVELFNEEARAAERAIDAQQHCERLKDPVVQAAEQAVNTQQRAARREDPVVQMRAEELRLWRVLNAAEDLYEIDISDGPIHVCSCCVRLIIRTSIDKTINFCTNFPTRWDFDFVDFHFLLDARVDNVTIQLCCTCVSYMKRRRLPSFCFSTFRFPLIPLLLVSAGSRLAARMASRQIALMHTKKLSYDGQLGIRSNVINVPIDVQCSSKGDEGIDTPTSLRLFDLRKYLIANSPLYEGVTFNDRWQTNHPGDEVNFVVNPADATPPANTGNEEADPEEGDQWDEMANEPDFGGEAVLLQNENVLAVAEAAVQYAPGDEQRPVGIFADPQAEGLTFSNLYCGQLPPAPPRTTPGARFKYEVMHRDPRFRTDTECLFWKNAVLTQIKIASQIGIALR